MKKHRYRAPILIRRCHLKRAELQVDESYHPPLPIPSSTKRQKEEWRQFALACRRLSDEWQRQMKSCLVYLPYSLY